MRTWCCLLFFLVIYQTTYAQNYYVASLQGEVYYNDVPLQKRDRLQVSGTLRFGSQNDWVKLSGPGGIYTLSAYMRDEGSSEFLLTVRQELFPPVRHIATTSATMSVNLDEPAGWGEPLELPESFYSEVSAHLERCKPGDVEAFLFDYRFGDFLSERYQIHPSKLRDVLVDSFDLPKRQNWSFVDPLWAQDYYYSSEQSKAGYQFLSETALPLPASLQEKSHKYVWLHQTEEGLSYRKIKVKGKTTVSIRKNEFPEELVRSALIRVKDMALIDRLLEQASTIDDAYRYLCSCYGVGNYMQRAHIILSEFYAPAVIPRKEFEEDMKFHIEVSQATNMHVFLIDYEYGTYIFETYGNVYRPKEALRKLGLREGE